MSFTKVIKFPQDFDQTSKPYTTGDRTSIAAVRMGEKLEDISFLNDQVFLGQIGKAT